MEPHIAAANAFRYVFDARPGEKAIIICDPQRKDIGDAFARGAIECGLWSRLVSTGATDEIRSEAPPHIREVILTSGADIFINLLRGPSEETPFRIDVIKLETRLQKRLGHCPGITMDMLTEGALALTGDEYRQVQELAFKTISSLQGVMEIRINNDMGCDLLLSTKERPFFTDTKYDWKLNKWMNLPVGEVIVAPVENSLEGTLVCDLAIGGIGRLSSPVTVNVKEGKVVDISTDDPEVGEKVKKALSTDQWSSIVGEFAIGINPSARLCDEFLEIEKIAKTSHIAFGNNTDMPGGKNPAKNHMDFLISNPTVVGTKENGDQIMVIKDGEWVD